MRLWIRSILYLKGVKLSFACFGSFKKIFFNLFDVKTKTLRNAIVFYIIKLFRPNG